MIFEWEASWVAYDADPRCDLGVCPLKLSSKPGQLILMICADQRYRLYVGDAGVA